MPKLEPKVIQKELEAGKVWPVYWLYGAETMKSRELLKRIRNAVLGENASSTSVFNEARLCGGENSSTEVLDAASALSLGGGTRLVVVTDAHLLKEPERLSELFGPSVPVGDLSVAVVLIAKDLDGRKKFSKQLVEGAAVVSCEAIDERDREPWIGYLAKKRGLSISARAVDLLLLMDPWSLDLVERELEKIEISQIPAERDGALVASEDVLLGGSEHFDSERFLDVFFGRKLEFALPMADTLGCHPDIALPLLGLIAWNVRMLSLLIKEQEGRVKSLKLNSFLVDKLNRWSKFWSLPEIEMLQRKLSEVDFGTKQTQRIPLGLWSDLIQAFCQ